MFSHVYVFVLICLLMENNFQHSKLKSKVVIETSSEDLPPRSCEQNASGLLF